MVLLCCGHSFAGLYGRFSAQQAMRTPSGAGQQSPEGRWRHDGVFFWGRLSRWLYICHGLPKPTCLELFMANDLVFRWPKPFFLMGFVGLVVFTWFFGLLHLWDMGWTIQNGCDYFWMYFWAYKVTFNSGAPCHSVTAKASVVEFPQAICKICWSRWVHLPQTEVNFFSHIWGCHHLVEDHPPQSNTT